MAALRETPREVAVEVRTAAGNHRYQQGARSWNAEPSRRSWAGRSCSRRSRVDVLAVDLEDLRGLADGFTRTTQEPFPPAVEATAPSRSWTCHKQRIIFTETVRRWRSGIGNRARSRTGSRDELDAGDAISFREATADLRKLVKSRAPARLRGWPRDRRHARGSTNRSRTGFSSTPRSPRRALELADTTPLVRRAASEADGSLRPGRAAVDGPRGRRKGSNRRLGGALVVEWPRIRVIGRSAVHRIPPRTTASSGLADCGAAPYSQVSADGSLQTPSVQVAGAMQPGPAALSQAAPSATGATQVPGAPAVPVRQTPAAAQPT